MPRRRIKCKTDTSNVASIRLYTILSRNVQQTYLEQQTLFGKKINEVSKSSIQGA